MVATLLCLLGTTVKVFKKGGLPLQVLTSSRGVHNPVDEALQLSLTLSLSTGHNGLLSLNFHGGKWLPPSPVPSELLNHYGVPNMRTARPRRMATIFKATVSPC